MPFMKRRTSTLIVDKEDVVTFTDTLPAGFYQVSFDPKQGYYLEDTDGWSRPKKVYGNVGKRVDRVMNTFIDRPNGTGILLSGEKGSGKTLFARLLSLEAIDKGFPVIIVSSPYCGDDFNEFIQSIDQPALVLFDEFEKVYEEKRLQSSMLTLLDGVYPSKKLYVLTVNETTLNANMMNRPGRLFYHFKYSGVDEAFIRDYCKDNLKDEKKIEDLVTSTVLFDAFNFDMLQAVVEEINRYGESPKQAFSYLNIEPDTYGYYKVEIEVPGKTIVKTSTTFYDDDPSEMHGYRIGVNYKGNTKDWSEVFSFDKADLVSMNVRKKQFLFKNELGAVLIMTKSVRRETSAYDYLED